MIDANRWLAEPRSMAGFGDCGNVHVAQEALEIGARVCVWRHPQRQAARLHRRSCCFTGDLAVQLACEVPVSPAK